MKNRLYFFRSGGPPGLLREYPRLLRGEKPMKKRKKLMKKMLQKADKNPILRGSKVPCLKPRKPMPDPKNPKIEHFDFLIASEYPKDQLWFRHFYLIFYKFSFSVITPLLLGAVTFSLCPCDSA